jgi:hypothetical protein
MMTRDELDIDRLYYVLDVKQYVITPDGVGCFWYESLDQALRATGWDDEIRMIENVED